MDPSRTRVGIAAALVVLTIGGTVLDAAVEPVRDWFSLHSLTMGTLVGLVMIATTYLVVERALRERERRRWSEAAAPLLQAIATAGAGIDAEVRTASTGRDPGGWQQCQWLGELLARYQTALSGTPELVVRWHAALSLVQHARAVQAPETAVVDSEYEAAWASFETAFAGVPGLDTQTGGARTTWVLPAVHGGEGR